MYSENCIASSLYHQKTTGCRENAQYWTYSALIPVDTKLILLFVLGGETIDSMILYIYASTALYYPTLKQVLKFPG